MQHEGLTPTVATTAVPTGPAPWSGMAIAGFVCSLLGCLGITALAGLVLGIAGLFATSGGKRRGFGFAVAAIPLSLLSGIASGFLILLVIVAKQIDAMPGKVESAFALAVDNPKEGASDFRELTTFGFNAAVGDAELEQWFETVIATHGVLTQTLINPNANRLNTGPDGRFVQPLKGKFVNDTVEVDLTYAKHPGIGQIRIDDISVDGVSPRDGPTLKSVP